MDTPEPIENAQPVQDVNARENVEVSEIVNTVDVGKNGRRRKSRRRWCLVYSQRDNTCGRKEEN